MMEEITRDISRAQQFHKKVYPLISERFFGKEWGGKNNPGQWKEQTYAGIFYSLIREFDALQKALNANDHLSIVSFHCRNILELAVWADAFERDQVLIRVYYEEGVRDMQEIAKGLQTWQARTGRTDTNGDMFAAISTSAYNLGVADLDKPYSKLSSIAQGGQFEHHYTMLYRLCSKLMHATGLAVVMQIDQVSTNLKACIACVASNLFGVAIQSLCKQTDIQI